MLIRSFAVCTHCDLITYHILPPLSGTLAIFTTDTYDEGSIFEKSYINSIFYILKLLPAYWISITEGEKHSLEKTHKVQGNRLELSGTRVGEPPSSSWNSESMTSPWPQTLSWKQRYSQEPSLTHRHWAQHLKGLRRGHYYC